MRSVSLCCENFQRAYHHVNCNVDGEHGTDANPNGGKDDVGARMSGYPAHHRARGHDLVVGVEEVIGH